MHGLSAVADILTGKGGYLMNDMFGFMIFSLILLIAIFVAISRWVFRVNHIIDRLDRIVSLLSGQAEKPKSFMDGLKKGMND